MSAMGGCGMNTEDSRIIARFQRLTTELLVEKRLGQWHPELVDEIYRTSLELEQRGLKTGVRKRHVVGRSASVAARRVSEAQQPDPPPPPGSPGATQKQMPPRDPNDDNDDAEDEED